MDFQPDILPLKTVAPREISDRGARALAGPM